MQPWWACDNGALACRRETTPDACHAVGNPSHEQCMWLEGECWPRPMGMLCEGSAARKVEGMHMCGTEDAMMEEEQCNALEPVCRWSAQHGKCYYRGDPPDEETMQVDNLHCAPWDGRAPTKCCTHAVAVAPFL